MLCLRRGAEGMVACALRRAAAGSIKAAASPSWWRRPSGVIVPGGRQAFLVRRLHKESQDALREVIAGPALSDLEKETPLPAPAAAEAVEAGAEQADSKSEATISIDRSSLYTAAKKNLPKERLTDLGILMYAYLEKFGPLSVADYMDLCLAHPRYGYYTRTDSAKIGKLGDFITAPEISQMFGELIGVWGVASWEKLGMPKGLRVAEIGPGKGTLMKDLLRAVRSFEEFSEAVESVHMVETSIALREEQVKALGGVKGEDGKYTLPAEDGSKPVSWHVDISELPDGPLFLVAQELLDALPVHQFEYTKDGWRERVVVTDRDDSSPYHFKFQVADKDTPAVEHLKQSGLMPANPEVGMGIEVCPLGIEIVKKVAERVAKHGGAALFIDYGEDKMQADTLRGLKAHAMVDVRSEPGVVDLSCDVDFSVLRGAAEKVKGVKVFGPVTQGAFLSALGIEVRLAALMDNTGTDDKKAILLYGSYERLVDPNRMGRKYKAFAIVADKHQGPAVGFDINVV